MYSSPFLALVWFFEAGSLSMKPWLSWTSFVEQAGLDSLITTVFSAQWLH